MSSFVYHSANEKIHNGTILLESHAIKAVLLDSSHTPDQANHDEYADISADEVSDSGTGYTAGGVALSGVTVTKSGAVTTLDATDYTFASLTSGAAFRYVALIDDDVAGDPLICLLDPGSEQIPDGGSVILEWNTSGIITFTVA
jgi:hypothetical protein